jgi:hypothetical protein
MCLSRSDNFIPFARWIRRRCAGRAKKEQQPLQQLFL